MSDNDSTRSNAEDTHKDRTNKKGKAGKSHAGEGNLFKRWKEPSQNRMGNDISSEIKIANNNAGDEKRGHLDEGR